MLITFVDSQDNASLLSFAQPLYGLINYETMHRWFIWEQEIFKPFFFFSHLHNNKGKVVHQMSWRCVHTVTLHYVCWALRGLSKRLSFEAQMQRKVVVLRFSPIAASDSNLRISRCRCQRCWTLPGLNIHYTMKMSHGEIPYLILRPFTHDVTILDRLLFLK